VGITYYILDRKQSCRPFSLFLSLSLLSLSLDISLDLSLSLSLSLSIACFNIYLEVPLVLLLIKRIMAGPYETGANFNRLMHRYVKRFDVQLCERDLMDTMLVVNV
jgi:hypothetical protein